MKRISISKKTRFEVFKRDFFKCGYCGSEVGAGVVLEIDHIIPVAEGGTNVMENLITSCFDCNRGKSKNLLSSIDERFKVNVEKSNQFKEQKNQVLAFLEFQNNQKEIERQIFSQAISPLINSKCYLPSDWESSVRFFLKHLGLEEVFNSSKQAADTAKVWESKKFTYFCGICHKKIKSKAGHNGKN